MPNATFSIGISFTAEDVEEKDGVITASTGDLSLYFGRFEGFNNFHIGLLFENIAIQQGTEIESANITVYRVGGVGTVVGTLYGSAVDNADPWAAPGNLPTNITRTAAGTAFSSNTNGEIAIDATEQVREILNRPGWISAHNMAFLLHAEVAAGVVGWMNILDKEAGNVNIAHINIIYPLPDFVYPVALPAGTFLQPYKKTSPWNARPVGAVLSNSFVIPGHDGLHFDPVVITSNYSTGIFEATADDPPRTIYGNGESPPDSGIFYILDGDTQQSVLSMVIPHWPADAVADPSTDGHLDIYDSSTGIIHSLWIAKEFEPGVMTVRFYSWTKIEGRGWGDPAHYSQGVRAAQVPPSAGLMRIHECLDTASLAFPHALCMSLAYDGCASSPTYDFPSTSADADAQFANSGGFPEGALLMLPPDFVGDGAQSALMRKIIKTLQIYGAFVVDRNVGTPWALYAENGTGANSNVYVGGDNSGHYLDLITDNLQRVVSVDHWIDSEGNSFDAPETDLPLISLRGAWSGGGRYNSWMQRVDLPAVSVDTEFVNVSQTGIHTVRWAGPFDGTTYYGFVRSIGGAEIKVQTQDQGTGEEICQTAFYGNGENMPIFFKKPCILNITARSPAGAPAAWVSLDVTLHQQTIPGDVPHEDPSDADLIESRRGRKRRILYDRRRLERQGH